MQEPLTDIACNFNRRCVELSNALADLDSDQCDIQRHQEISKDVKEFFEYIQTLPDIVAASDHQATVLFEIDRTLSGYYGAVTFTVNDENKPLLRFLRDLMALWQQSFMIAKLVRLIGTDKDFDWTISFYERWYREAKETMLTEDLRMAAGLTLLLNDPRRLDIPTKLVLIELMGNIRIGKGVHEKYVDKWLLDNKSDLDARDMHVRPDFLSEIVLNLQTLHLLGIPFHKIQSKNAQIEKIIRYWSSQHDCIKALFSSWGWYWQNDYTSPLIIGEEVTLKEESPLFKARFDDSAQVIEGESYFDIIKHRPRNDDGITPSGAIPIFIYGHSGVGKTSYLLALAHQLFAGQGHSLTLGHGTKEYYESLVDDWHINKLPASSGNRVLHFWKDLIVANFSVLDYAGKEIKPNQWDTALQQNLTSARALLFFIDEHNFVEPSNLRGLSMEFAEILSFWQLNNPMIRHVPVTLMVTKCDRLLHEDLSLLKRAALLPSGFVPAVVEIDFPHRHSIQGQELPNQYDRLCDCIIQAPDNNVTPLQQDIIGSLLSNFQIFLDRAISLTYNYQIYFISSISPQFSKGKIPLFGVTEPIAWICDVLTGLRLQASVKRFNDDERILKDDLLSLQNKTEQIRKDVQIIEMELKKYDPKKWHIVGSRQIDKVKERQKELESQLDAIIEEYCKDRVEGLNSITAKLRVIDETIADKKRLLNGLDLSRTDYQKKLGLLESKGMGV